MNITIIRNDREQYVSKVTCKSGFLSWKSNINGGYFLIVRSVFGKPIDIDNVCRALKSVDNINCSEELRVSDSMSILLYKKPQDIYSGYTCPVKPARYSVIACEYIPEQQKMMVYADDMFTYCDVSATILISTRIIYERVKKGLFHTVMIPYTKIELSGNNPVGYTDGAVYYTFPNMRYKYPITKGMLKNGFIVPHYCNNQPIINSNSAGFDVEITGEV